MLAPDRQIMKTHEAMYRYWARPHVVTVRDPYDSVVSAIRRWGHAITDETVEREAAELFQSGFRSRHKVPWWALVLKYEDFYANLDGLLDQIARYLKIPVPEAVRSRFKEEFNIERVRQVCADRPFHEWDHETHIHGSHVSASLGRPGESKILTEAQRRTIDDILRLDHARVVDSHLAKKRF
ncbi:MAG TPA: hypothetical protein VKW08_10660 [Xanthobacteraceae bacterium]|jgi:hypothetical protein|nr:hypothetical protein [Xanthobacteraceae bacterium]